MTHVAIVHDWLVTYAGAERVLEQLLSLYPEADLYAVCDFLPDSERGFLRGRTPRTTFIQRLPRARLPRPLETSAPSNSRSSSKRSWGPSRARWSRSTCRSLTGWGSSWSPC